jgi:hypothetical protein
MKKISYDKPYANSHGDPWYESEEMVVCKIHPVSGLFRDKEKKKPYQEENEDGKQCQQYERLYIVPPDLGLQPDIFHAESKI